MIRFTRQIAHVRRVTKRVLSGCKDLASGLGQERFGGAIAVELLSHRHVGADVLRQPVRRMRPLSVTAVRPTSIVTLTGFYLLLVTSAREPPACKTNHSY